MRGRGQILRQELAGLGADLQIDKICDHFEQAFWAGTQPDLADYLSYIDEKYRHQLFVELLLVEWELRSHDATAPDWRLYQARFPFYASQVEEARLKQRGESPPAAPLGGPDAPTIGHFHLLETIGAGASGKVWKAYDPRLQRTIALKIPHTVGLGDNEMNRFLREGRAAAQLGHPRIVPVYEVGKEGDTVYIVSAFVCGQNLRDWLKSSRPTAREAATLCAQLAEALDHAHERGVIHRDLKPSNVILDDVRNPHIIDFGLAKVASDHRDMTLDGELIGTPAYMSPEQASGKAIAADRRTDVYGLGVILYEMLTGRPPFAGSHAAVIQQVIHQEPLALRQNERSIPRDLETICQKAMAKLPDDRYWSAQEMAVDLRRLLDGRPIVARRLRLWERAWRAMHRRPAIAAIAVLATLLAAALVFASRLAADKHALLGLKAVMATTSPAGARMIFVPLDPDLGEPLPEQAIRPRSRSPVKVELPAGDYLVVAVLDDGRFHEVYRHVPREAEVLPGVYAHQRWHLVGDQTLTLPTIGIPESDVTRDMALITALGSDGGFYIDSREFTLREFRSHTRGKDPLDKRAAQKSEEHAVAVPFHAAVDLAEASGKRLPTERELAGAAAQRQPLASSATADGAAAQVGPGPVGSPPEDRTQTVPAVVGLCSNVAEWTVSRSLQPKTADLPLLLDPKERVVFGGDVRTTLGQSPTSMIYPLDTRAVVSEVALHPGLGFRCVRSIAPRFVDE